MQEFIQGFSTPTLFFPGLLCHNWPKRVCDVPYKFFSGWTKIPGHRHQITFQGTVTSSGNCYLPGNEGNKESATDKKRERWGSSTSFYSFPGAHLLCKTDFCHCLGNVQWGLWCSPGSWQFTHQHWAQVSRQKKKLAQLSAFPSLQHSLFQSQLFCCNSQNAWDKTFLCLVLHNRWLSCYYLVSTTLVVYYSSKKILESMELYSMLWDFERGM